MTDSPPVPQDAESDHGGALRKALVSFGTGPAARTLAIALPTFRDYAERHGYDLCTTEVGDTQGRPMSWGKVPLLRRLLCSYDFVLWIDADAIIVDNSLDIETLIPPDNFQAFVVLDIAGNGGPSPCCGVWALRASERTQRFLAQVWDQEDLTGHKWWEQAAVMRLLGWRIDCPVGKERTSEWDDGTFVLPGEWNVIPKFAGHRYTPARIRHYGADTTLRRVIEMGTDLAEVRGNWPRYWLGVCERRSRPHYRAIATKLGRR